MTVWRGRDRLLHSGACGVACAVLGMSSTAAEWLHACAACVMVVWVVLCALWRRGVCAFAGDDSNNASSRVSLNSVDENVYA